ncbi:hypothetical protein OPAG_08467 [Rhodococcus opacus PD630]|nr:hypothetical protein Pd630_LPD13047 [Rhodococcus opacus PD630]EHI43383.1 hypothetical protein OPAG_08467 [Rhodococcus opacus PD630]
MNISTYNATPAPGPANYMSLLINRALIAGFVVFDYDERALRRGGRWHPFCAGGRR